MDNWGECENCLAIGPRQSSKVRGYGLEDTLLLCKECGNFDAQDFEREQNEADDV